MQKKLSGSQLKVCLSLPTGKSPEGSFVIDEKQCEKSFYHYPSKGNPAAFIYYDSMLYFGMLFAFLIKAKARKI